MSGAARTPAILSVDDSADDARLLGEALRETGSPCRLASVRSAEEAMAYLEGGGAFADRAAHPFPDLILLDIQMPGSDGFTVLEWIRGRQAEWRRVPVVILTTAHNYAEIRRAYDLGANSFLVKPAQFDELAEMLQQLVGYWLRYNETIARPGD